MMVTRDEDGMEEDEDDDAPILKARLMNQLLEKGDEGENDKDENYNDQEDCDEPLLCYTKTSSGGYLGRKANGQSSEGLMSTGAHLDDATNNSGEKAVGNEGADWGGGGGSDLAFTEAIPEQVTSSVTMKTDDIDTDDEATQQDKDGPTLQPGMSNVPIETDGIDTDDEATQQNKDGPTPHSVASNMAITTDDIDTVTEETIQNKDGPTPVPVLSNAAIKTGDIDTDDDATQQDKEPMPVSVVSNVAIKTDDIDTDTEETIQDEGVPMLQTSNKRTDDIDAPKLEKAAPADNLTMTVSASSTSDKEDAMVLKLFEEISSCIEKGNFDQHYVYIQEMLTENQYLVNFCARCFFYMLCIMHHSVGQH